MTDRRRQIEEALAALAPALVPKDRTEVVEHALWSKGLKRASAPKAAWLSLVSYLRHRFTDYDRMLEEGYDVEEARYFSSSQLSKVLTDIGCHRQLYDKDPIH
jgi:hypothetical protein